MWNPMKLWKISAMSYRPKLLPINPGIVNAIARAAASPARVVDGCRIFVREPKFIMTRHALDFWGSCIHLGTAHATEWEIGPIWRYIEVYHTREPDYYTLVFDNILKPLHPHYESYNHACRVLIDIAQNPTNEARQSANVVTVIAVWK